MISIYHNGLAPRLEAKINAPNLTQPQAEMFVNSLIKSSAEQAVAEEWTWRRFRTQDGKRWFEESPDLAGKQFWLKLSPTFKAAIVNYAGKIIYNQLIGVASQNPNVLKGLNVLTPDACNSAVRDAIASKEMLYEAGNVPKPPPAPPKDLNDAMNTPVVEKMMRSAMPYLGRAIVGELRKGVEHPDLTNFVPNSQSALELYKRKGVVPEGYIDRDSIAKLSSGYATELMKAKIPMLKKSYFRKNVAERLAVELMSNSSSWATFLSNFTPSDSSGFQKGCVFDESTAKLSLMDRLVRNTGGIAGPDFVKSNPQDVLKALSEAFSSFSAEDVRKVVDGFAKDSSASVAAISIVSEEM